MSTASIVPIADVISALATGAGAVAEVEEQTGFDVMIRKHCTSNDIYQLDLMTDLLGILPFETIARIRNVKARRYLSSVRKKKPIPLSYKFPNADSRALCLLERMFAFDHKDKPSPEEALTNLYVTNLARVEREPSTQSVIKKGYSSCR